MNHSPKPERPKHRFSSGLEHIPQEKPEDCEESHTIHKEVEHNEQEVAGKKIERK